MFQVGEYVLCGGRAVCQVHAVGPLGFDKAGAGAYYTLCPPFSSSEETLYVPVDTALPLRRILSEEEALAALEALQKEEPTGESGRPLGNERYKEMLASCDVAEELRLFQALYQKERAIRGSKRRLTQVDTLYYKLVERLLCDEFSLALGETTERVMERLYAAVSGGEVRAAEGT